MCDSPSGSFPKEKEYTYTCKALPSCSSSEDCEPNEHCCVTEQIDPDPKNQGKCADKGIYQNNPKWLCDPPIGFVKTKEVSKSNEVGLLNTILEFFSKLFS